MAAFNLTPKRIQSLRLIQSTPGCLVGHVAQSVLCRSERAYRGLWSQAATRMGAGYCQALRDAGLVVIDTYVDSGYGRVTITPKGEIAILEADTLDAALARCSDSSSPSQGSKGREDGR